MNGTVRTGRGDPVGSWVWRGSLRLGARALAVLWALAVGCGGTAPPRTESPRPHPAAVPMHRAPVPPPLDDDALRLAEEKAQGAGVHSEGIRWSPRGTYFAFMVPDDAYRVHVFDRRGEAVAVLSPFNGGPARALRFIDEDRLCYRAPRVSETSSGSSGRGSRPGLKRKHHRGRAGASLAAAPSASQPRMLFVIHPINPGARVTTFEGWGFSIWDGSRFAYVAGEPGTEFVSVDGVQVYPRRGRTTIQSAPAWSEDGHSLAFVERSGTQSRLVVLVEVADASGDNIWDLPASVGHRELHVFWAGPGRVVVGQSLSEAQFAISFSRVDHRGH